MNESDLTLESILKDISKSYANYIIQYNEQCNGLFLIDNLGYILSYDKLSALIKGINNFLAYYSPDAIDNYNAKQYEHYKKCSEDMDNKFKEERRTELKMFNAKYDSYIGKTILSDIQISKYFLDLQVIHKDYINTENTAPPYIIYLFKGTEIIHITRTSQPLDACISYYKKAYDFDGYAFSEVPAEFLNDTYIKALILNPRLNVRPNCILQSSYATLNQIKKRYDINKNTIKNIIKLYDVSTCYLNNHVIVEKDKFKEALDSHIARQKMDITHSIKELYVP